MLHVGGAGADGPQHPASPSAADSPTSAPSERPAEAAAATAPIEDVQDDIARFNERNSGRRRTLWQVLEDAPVLLRRLWSDLRRGDTRMLRALIRGGLMLQLFVVVMYIVSPVRGWIRRHAGRHRTDVVFFRNIFYCTILAVLDINSAYSLTIIVSFSCRKRLVVWSWEIIETTH